MERATAREGLASALYQMEQALSLLDTCGAPGDIGAHLDLAMCRLREHLQSVPTTPDERQWSSGQHSSR